MINAVYILHKAVQQPYIKLLTIENKLIGIGLKDNFKPSWIKWLKHYINFMQIK